MGPNECMYFMSSSSQYSNTLTGRLLYLGAENINRQLGSLDFHTQRIQPFFSFLFVNREPSTLLELDRAVSADTNAGLVVV